MAPRPEHRTAEEAALTQIRLLALPLLLLLPAVARAAAPECLSGVDAMIVEYDIPVGQNIWGLPTQTPPQPAAKAKLPPRKKPAKSAAGNGTTAPSAGDKPPAAGRAPAPHHPLTETQRKRLEETLQSARLAEARGEEAQCMELLGRAREIVKR